MDRVVGRRALLGAAAGVGLAALAGCARSPGASPPTAVTTGSAPVPDRLPPDATGAAATTGPPAPSTSSATDLFFPTAGDDWPSVDPETVGWDPAGLDDVAAFVATRATQSFLVVLDGRILLERHWAGTAFTRDIASAQKSVVSTLAGIAHAVGELDLDAAASAYLGPGWSDAPAADEDRITVHHLLTMTTGLDERLQRVGEPGAAWDYNNTTYQLVRPAVEQASGLGIADLTRQRLWDPIGVSDTARWAPRAGSGQYSTDAKGHRFWGLTMGVRDMARFGLLVQRAGTWAGRPVVPADELARALRPSQALNPAYGELWWLNGQPSYQLPQRPSVEGMLVPAAPADMVAALGMDDQKIYVSAGTGLVMTRLGDRAGPPADARSAFDNELWRRLLTAAP